MKIVARAGSVIMMSLAMCCLAVPVPAVAADEGAAPVTPQPKPDRGKPALELVGVVIADEAGENRALIREAHNVESSYLRGDVVGGMEIKEITGQGVLLAGGAEGKTLFLRSGLRNSPPPPAGGMISLDFSNVEIRVVIKYFSDLTGTNFIVDNNVRGAITVIAPRRIPVSEAMNLLESILEVKGFALVPAGDVIKVMSKKEASQRSIPLVLPNRGESPPAGDTVVTRMIQLQHADAGLIRNALGPLFSKDASVIAYPAANTLIITDAASRIDRLAAVIEQLDRPGETVPIRTLIKKYSDLSGQNVIVGPGVRGNVMFNTPGEIPRDEYLAALKAVIEVSGCTMEQSGSFIKIERVPKPKEDAKEAPAEEKRSGPQRSGDTP